MSVIPIAKQLADVPQDKFLEIGYTGLRHWGGILHEEFLRELRGPDGVRIYNEMAKNDAIIGAGLLAFTILSREVKFRIDPAIKDDAKSEEVAEFIRGALFQDLSLSWPDMLGEILSFLPYGWSYFEMVFKRRQGDTNDPATQSRFNDNKIGWRKWAIRGQDTLVRWALDPNGGVNGMYQRAAPSYNEVLIPIEKSLLFRTLVERNNPEGASILRSAYQSYYYKRRLQVVRGIGIERDLAGMPVLTPPEGLDIWNPKDEKAVAMKQVAERIVRNIRRDEHEGILKPHGWELILLASSGGRQFDITEVIGQLNAEMAMSMFTDFLLVGHEEVGARSLGESKQAGFGKAAGGYLDSVCGVVNRFAIPQLVKLNGWDESLSPTLAHGPVAEVSLTELTEFVAATSKAGLLFPDVGLENHLRDRAQLPPVPESAGRVEPNTI